MTSRRKRQQWSNTVWENHAYDKVKRRGGSDAEANKVARRVTKTNQKGQKKGSCAITALTLGGALASAIAAWRGWA